MSTRILVVDDDPISCEILKATLEAEGFDVTVASDGLEAQRLLTNDATLRLVISDWEMPNLDGPSLCRWLRSHRPSPYCFFVLLTGRSGSESVVEGLSAGVDEFLVKPIETSELLLRVRTGTRVLSLETRDTLIFALAKLAESRDPETGKHLERTQRYCRMLAEELQSSGARGKLDNEFVRLVGMTTPLHDIGKVGIPDFVLLKPGRLSEDEFQIMKTHTLIGAETLQSALQHSPKQRFLEIARDIARSHHERWDGKGYPDGLSGEQTPLSARIMSVADVYDALTSVRVYKNAMPHDVARAMIRDGAGTQFDAAVVETFLKLEARFSQVRAELQDVLHAEPAPAKADSTAGAGPTPTVRIAA